MKTEEMRDEARNLVGQVSSATQRSLDRAAEFAESAQNAVRSTARDLLDREREAVGYTRDVVGANPLSSIAIAVVVGFVLGWLIKR
jgi:ElaB/YqjD/DUF883 family membrane-anchored ribosome-binding protein